MKSSIRIKVAADEWKNGGVFYSGKGGGSLRGAKKWSTPKAIKEIVASFKAQNIVPVVAYEGEYATITAETA